MPEPDPQYFFANGNEQRGPHTAGEIVAMGLRPDTLVWREGMANWERFDSVPELLAMIPKAAPAPPPPPLGYGQPPPPPPGYGPQGIGYQSPPGYAPPPGYPYAPTQDNRRIIAGVFGILMGSLGIHKFILGYTGAGIIMLLVSVLTCGWGSIIMWPIGLIEGIIYLTKSDSEFHQIYVLNRREWF
jgi:TM2 domain-containing membrane protein YozV